MKRVRVIVEVDVPDATDLTEKALGWHVRRALPRPFKLGNRALAIKEFSRVLQYLPGGIRAQ